jgi:cytoskeletal protein CcmA (bactofilin family)
LAFFGKPDPPPSPQHSPSPSVPPPVSSPSPPERTSPPSPPAAAAAPAPTASGATTVLGSRLRIVGDVSGDEDLVVNGKLEGKIRVDRKVVVNVGAEVEGDIQAKSVTIGGRVHGQVMASERAELLPSGRVQGNVHAPRIVMAEGAQIQGRVVMPSDAATRPLSGSRVEEPKRPVVPPRTETTPPKPDDTARRPVSPPGTGG